MNAVTWAAKDLPARLDVAATAKLLGFTENDIQILMAVDKLMPPGNPAQNASKWFAAVEIIRLATDKVKLVLLICDYGTCAGAKPR